MSARRLVLGALAFSVSACVRYDQQSALNAAGPQASAVRSEFYLMLAVAVLVYLIVVGALALIIRNRRRTADDDGDTTARERKATRAIRLAVGVTVPILFVLLVYDFAVGRGLTPRHPSSMLTIRLTGHQWWWEVEYEDPVAQNRVHTANEIHIPVGRTVMVKLVSHDVIHSFWVPNLGGKKDLIPGHYNETWIRADRPGVFRSQCAEYCGLEHAKMALMVVAEPPNEFAQWVVQQRQPVATPTDSETIRGQEIFENSSCSSCHAVASTRASGKIGPDLTHVASRLTLAAGSLGNTRGNLAGWIVDPQTIKPGVHMPPNSIEPPDLQALVAYLRTLR